ncbi:MAG: DUF115 domain-containing protein [Verrucomicrobiae bacterium]|nr:DUF115 domain-containing protein [Verrucomicrobiae bacterium]
MDYALLKREKGIGKGKRCFIIASGPSLNKEDLSPLKKEVTIGVNESFKALPFEPTYLCIGDRFLWPKIKGIYASMTNSKVFCGGGMDGTVGRGYSGKNLIGVIPMNRQESIIEHGINFDLESGPLRIGYGVVPEVAIPFACYCGFSEIYLLGCDASQKGYAYSNPARGEGTQKVLDKSILSFEAIARQKLPAKIINLSQGSLLSCFQFSSLEKILCRQ